jgi:hypothetical protein
VLLIVGTGLTRPEHLPIVRNPPCSESLLFMRSRPHLTAAFALLLSALGCGSDDPHGPGPADPMGSMGGDGGAGGSPLATGGTAGAEALDFDPTPEDFECLLAWDQVRNFRVANKLGQLEEALRVANSPEGGVYPVGTILQLVTFEAMVKRGPGFSPESNDWEFFFLSVTAEGTTIEKRGVTDVVNQFNGNCFDCHREADPRFDFVCEQGRGCIDLPLTPELIAQIQSGDPRCSP